MSNEVKNSIAHRAGARRRDRRYREKNPAAREKRAAGLAAWRKKNIELVRLKKREYELKNRDKIIAHRKVCKAKKEGLITSLPCQVCGNAKSFAHHEDYNKPFDLLWLCGKHHLTWHKIFLSTRGVGYEG